MVRLSTVLLIGMLVGGGIVIVSYPFVFSPG